ncbi:Tex family protein [Motilimonas eburnea]|uniref:Tex family protein n=1 Tax=Motilimonas eburnea TaxID=1737488 RepID=UPI001E60014A|nr:Tex family protein [Motilimonas eburnea]MCE2573533.1 RNA-binding transcriptional accessory protein [Motilimonas eburnea]
MHAISQTLAQELGANTAQVNAAIQLLDEGATVPFIARYRKEVTGGLDDGQLRNLDQRLTYLRELEDRRTTIISSIQEQGKLTEALHQQLNEADTKTRLEDLYLPYKQKRVTKGQLAINAGLEPLADKLLAHPELDPDTAAQDFINPELKFNDSKAVLEGAKYILMERFAQDAELISQVRQHLQQNAALEAKVIAGKEQEGLKFKDYFNYSEKIAKIPSHRALALLRGRNEGVLQLSLNSDPEREDTTLPSTGETLIARFMQVNQMTANPWLKSVVQWTWRIKLLMQLENELITSLREQAEIEAIEVFAKNLTDLLMAAPGGAKVTLALDPGLRTGVKVAVVDTTGKLLAYSTIYPHAPRNDWQGALAELSQLCQQHGVEIISIGNGTASRETDQLVADLIKAKPELRLTKIMVSEAGASVYSASELAAKEFPDLDVSIRGAVSIARRLQDPLAELVKIEPKAIGVGQYQHDVNQTLLAKKLDGVVEDCVNAVGVDVNTASAALLAHVAGLNSTIAQNIVDYRDENGIFVDRSQLKKVARLGPKAFQQCAGFLRIQGGKNPLDASAVHPEAYPVVKAIIQQSNLQISELMGNPQALKSVNPKDFVNDDFGLPTISDIFKELEKPGRDPRPEFKTATFKEGVNTIKDLQPEMILEGVVTNVANFGAFVDIGVHQDGLVHISALSDKFVSDPREVVKAGQIVKVKVIEVDVPRKRISLTMKLHQSAPNAGASAPKQPRKNKPQQSRSPALTNNAFADAFNKAKSKR